MKGIFFFKFRLREAITPKTGLMRTISRKTEHENQIYHTRIKIFLELAPGIYMGGVVDRSPCVTEVTYRTVTGTEIVNVIGILPLEAVEKSDEPGIAV